MANFDLKSSVTVTLALLAMISLSDATTGRIVSICCYKNIGRNSHFILKVYLKWQILILNNPVTVALALFAMACYGDATAKRIVLTCCGIIIGGHSNTSNLMLNLKFWCKYCCFVQQNDT